MLQKEEFFMWRAFEDFLNKFTLCQILNIEAEV